VQRLREELEAKDKELQRRERLAALGEMAAGVAHEIRNPLGGIGLYASLLERDLADRPAQQAIAKRITAGVQNLEEIIRDILAFAGGAEPRMTQTTVGAVVDAALELARPKLELMGLALEIDAGIDEVEIHCDASQMCRALSNLIFNGIEAAGSGGRVWIRLSGFDGESASIAVEDDGPGIEPTILPRIFNPFFTTKDRGTGLGLSIVHGIVEAHGGRISAGQRAGGGASFVLTLPRKSKLSFQNCKVCRTSSVDCRELPTVFSVSNP
jgi:signal transduction histidine kinase